MASQVTPQRSAAVGKRKRGRESVGDMVRSMGLVMILVVVVWYLAQPPDRDAERLRVVDPSSDIASLRSSAPGIPVPAGLPSAWRATSSTLQPGTLRVGWVTPSEQYAEYAASTTSAPGFLDEISGRAVQIGTLQVGGVAWRQLRDAGEHDTLVREVDGRTVVVGGVRETSTLDELQTLAAAVR